MIRINTAEKFVVTLSCVISLIGTIVIVVMMMLVVIDVSLRYFFNMPIVGIPELVEFSMVCVGFSGLAWCAVKNGHVAVDLVVNRFPERIQAGFDIIAHAIGIIVFAVLSWQGFNQTAQMYRIDNVSRTLHMSTYPFYLVLAVGCGTLCLVLSMKLIQSVLRVLQR